MSQFILRYCGEGAAPAADVRRVRAMRGVRVLDETPRMMLVEAADDALREFAEGNPDWLVTAERTVAPPDPHPRPRRRPDEDD